MLRAHISKSAVALMLAIVACTATACRDEMYNQPKAEPLEQSLFFADSQASRPMIEGTVPRVEPTRGSADESDSNARRLYDNVPVVPAHATAAEIRALSIHPNVTRQLLDRGHERYDIYCSPCHGRTGDGNGMIVQRGFPPPPSFHLDRLRAVADGHIYDVITNGFGSMFSYANRVKPNDRWAIAAYIRALQLSRKPDASPRKTPVTVDGNGH